MNLKIIVYFNLKSFQIFQINSHILFLTPPIKFNKISIYSKFDIPKNFISAILK